MPHPSGPAHPLHLKHQRGGGLRARAGRVHVTLRPSVVLTLVLIGWILDGAPDRALSWVVGGTAALLVHEVAHAWIGRLGGATPYVEISWHGGITRWQPPGALTSRAEAAALLTGPLVGAVVGWAALAGSRSVTQMSVPAASLAGDGLAIIGAVSLVVAALDALPIFPRDGARLLLLVMPGPPVTAVVRTATVGAVVAATTTAVLLVTPVAELALVTGVLTVTNAWLALRGDRAVGRPVPEAIEARDWRSVRRRLAEGCDSPELAALAQERALAVSAFHAAADIGDAALDRGWHIIGFARRTARARAFLEQDDLAVARVRDAVGFGADPDELAEDGILRYLTTRLDWPSSARRPARRPTRGEHVFAIDLRDGAAGRA